MKRSAQSNVVRTDTDAWKNPESARQSEKQAKTKYAEADTAFPLCLPVSPLVEQTELCILVNFTTYIWKYKMLLLTMKNLDAINPFLPHQSGEIQYVT